MQSAQSSSGTGTGTGGADSSLELEDALLEDDDVEVNRSTNRKPHFLDYDNKPPAGLEDQVVFPRPTPAGTANGTSEEVSNRGTWPAATSGGSSSAKYNGGGRQNHSMYGDMSEVCPKMECVYSLLSMLGSTNSLEMSTKFMELSRNRDTCSALRRSGCIPLLVQIIHNDPNETARRNARQSLNNVIGCHPDDKAGRREVKVLKLIEQLVDYADQLRDYSETEPASNPDVAEDPEKHPIAAITTLMKISFDEEHRHAMCQLGALQTISTLIQLDHAVHGANPSAAGAPKCVTMRRYAGMILTNLTFGDGNNKSLLCSNKGFMRALVAQIGSSSDELVQVTASVLRNLSWRADSVIKQTLSEIGTVAVLARAAMVCTIENTLKAILSALWNLSNHCPPNRSEFCEVPGALEFLIDMLSYEAPSKTMHVIENAGGILRNISSHVALREDYRRILRRKNCLKILLEQLKSPSLTVVSNACGTLGSLSGDCAEDQRFLRENGAIPMLRSLIYSKHKMISNGSSMALKNLLKPTAASASSSEVSAPLTVATTLSGPTSDLPSLNARKKKALEQELEEKFLPPKASPEEKDICTVRKDDDVEESEDNNSEDDDEVVSHSGVHIRLVADPPEEDAEKPVNYSLKEEEVTYQDYQETDIDQITDYSLRYAENQSEESEVEGEDNKRGLNPLMAEEDSVRCYYTEGTPQIISSATSMSDLRGGKAGSGPVAKSVPIPISGAKAVVGVTAGGLTATATPGGCDTPDKPYNYCEEGTPDFSRDASLNVLELSGDPKLTSTKPISPLDQPDGVDVVVNLPPSTPGGDHHHHSHHNTSKQVSFLNTAEETPLMFSRTSSMGSLSSAEPALVCADDKSSIVSEFSRFPSGVISPSELPDSPTQSMPHSPRRSSGMMGAAGIGKRKGLTVEESRTTPPPPPVKSAFEDTVAKFEVENTPAAFSCATSLSNLSLEEREDQESKEVVGVVAAGPPVLPVPEVSGSDDGESDAGGDDDLLLQSMVSMGMKKERPEPPEEPDRDQLRQFCTEDTPARLSEAPSNCDLSVLSFDTRNDTGTDLGLNGHDSDDSSNVSAEQSDRLLEECIRSGMPQPKAPKENPLGMMRRNPVHLVEPLYANDEVNNFYLEDSPYAFSTISGLSDLTVATEAAEGRKQISTLGTGRQPIPAPGPQPPHRNGSLSSLSVESDADDRLLDEAIAAGIGSNKRTSPPAVVNRMTAAAVDGNDSLDSIDSVGSNDPQGNSLLEQCIANGMKKPPVEKQTAELRAGMNFAQLARGGAALAAPPTDLDSIPDSDRDYDLLRECIARGMPRNSTTSVGAGGGVSTLELTQNLQRLAISANAGVVVAAAAAVPLPSVPKNVDTTPVVVTRPDAGAIRNVTSAGVVEPAAADNTLIVNGTTTITTITSSSSSTINMARSDPGRRQQPPPTPPVRDTFQLQQSGSELDRSNEFPASAMMTSSNLLVESMQMSNEFTADLVPTTTSDKHKDPDLMLKSVERLTQELVSTAASKAENSSNNNVNTWDEDLTCANDVSFPSLSVQAPRIQYSESAASTASVTSGTMSFGDVEEDDTATISDEIDSKALDALEDQTPMNEERPLPGFVGSNEDLSLRVDEIHFQLGGEVKHPMVGGHLTHGPPDGGISFSTVSTLTNSTIIAIEATKVANQLQNLAIVESADVDLSKINCPFAGSDSILISDCSDSEMTFRNELSGRKIPTFPAGLVARRALGQTTFNDSMNSLHNLDSIGPPSIMDELMDSMISVASITSEVVDLDSGHAGTLDADRAGSSGHSSLTLNSSSLENLIKFSPTMNAGMVVTPGGGGPGLGMGCKSTPMSPKRAERRQAMKDRYKTYTIPNAAELLVDLEQKKDEGGSGGEEVKTPTPSVPSTPSPKKSSKERRAENKSRYETQIITGASLTNGHHHEPTIHEPESPRTPPARATIIATPVAFSPLTLQSPAPMSLERHLSPEDPDVDDDPVTYTIQETTPRRKSFEQKLPTIASSTGLPPAGPVAQQVRTPLASPSKMPTPARIVTKINPPTPTPDPGVVKTVRGTKKPAYVSPYRKTVVSAPAVIARTPAAPLPTAKKEPLATPKLRSQSSLVETSRARPQPLRARSSVGSKRNSLELNGTGSVRSSISSTTSSSTDIPKIRERQPSLGAIGGAKAKVAPSPEPLLIRQGTFTKDEPTNPEVPVVTSAPSTPAKTARKPGATGSMIPSSASSSRLTTIAKSRIVLHKSISMDASKTPSTPTAASAGPPSGESTPLTSRFRLTSARTSLVDYKKPNTTGGRLSTPVRNADDSPGGTVGVPATPTSPGSMIPMRRKSGIALPKRTNLTMKSNPDVLKGKLEGVRNAFVRTAASGVKTGSR